MRDPQIGFGSLHLRLGALEGPERILVIGACRVSLFEQDAIALFLRGGLGDRGYPRGKVGLDGSDLVLVVDGVEPSEQLTLPDDGTDIDIAGYEAAACLKSHLAYVASTNSSGSFRDYGKLEGLDHDGSDRPNGRGSGSPFFGTAGEREASEGSAQEQTW